MVQSDPEQPNSADVFLRVVCRSCRLVSWARFQSEARTGIEWGPVLRQFAVWLVLLILAGIWFWRSALPDPWEFTIGLLLLILFYFPSSPLYSALVRRYPTCRRCGSRAVSPLKSVEGKELAKKGAQV